MTEQSCPPNAHAFGTFGTSAAEQPLVPKPSGDPSSGTFGKEEYFQLAFPRHSTYSSPYPAIHKMNMKTATTLIATILALAVTASSQASPAELVIEAQIDGPSALHIKPSSIYWENGVNAKPGKANLLNEPTYVNGIAWLPKWKNAKEDRGDDKTAPYNVGLGSTDLAFELVSVTLERGQEGIEQRSTIVEKREHGEYILTFPDVQSGERWYKFVVRKR